MALKWRKLSYENAAESLGLGSEVVRLDDHGKRVVATPEFRRALRGYQEAQQLNATGRLEYKTLEMMSGRRFGEIVWDGSVDGSPM